VKVHNWNKRNFRLLISNLNKEIDPSGSYVKPTSNGLTIVLKKEKSAHWDNLILKPSPIGDVDKNIMGGDQQNKDPGAGMMEMMKEMYNSGDDNMKKMIAESFSKAQGGEKPY
jgi:calcyclin binding protein